MYLLPLQYYYVTLIFAMEDSTFCRLCDVTTPFEQEQIVLMPCNHVFCFPCILHSQAKVGTSAPLCPDHVQPSLHHIFTNQDYGNTGAKIAADDDVSQADLIMGVKRPKSLKSLPADKTYISFLMLSKDNLRIWGSFKTVLTRRFN